MSDNSQMVRDAETAALQEELNQYKQEKEKIRNMLGQIGGKNTAKVDKIVNFIFIAMLVALFISDVLRHLHLVELPFETMVSIEIGILLVSIKIIWLIEKQNKVNHFQFWILNSIEFRLNNVNNKIIGVENSIDELKKTSQTN